MKKKILSVLLAVVMLASACSMIVPVSAETMSMNFYEDTDGVWHIANETGINEFRSTFIASQETLRGAKVVLDDDITMTAPLSDIESYGYGFIGTFDGQGHTISNLKIEGATKYSGLLGTPYDANNAPEITVKNLALVNASMTKVGTTVKQCTGFIFGYANGNVTFENLYVQGSMAVTGELPTSGTDGHAMGALIGGVNGSTTVAVNNSYFDITTENSEKAIRRSGAIFGATVGNGVEITMTNCALYGNIQNFGYSFYWVGLGFANGGQYKPTLTSTNFITDVNLGSSFGQRTGLITGLNMYNSDLTAQNVSGLDATAVEGFTATVGHMVPTSLLKMFPQHCLETSTADGAKVEFEGYQTTNLVDGKAKVRLVATLADDYKNYDEVGFEVVAVYDKAGVKPAKSQKVSCTKVYSSISAVTGNEAYPESISASSIIDGEGYIFAMVITGVPEGITLQVRTYSVSGETTTYGATEVFTIADIPGGTVGGN